MRSFRGLRYFLAPPWLTGKGDGEKIAFTFEWLLDAFLEKLRQGLNSRFPTRAGESALNLIIGDRGLLRGRSETAASVAARLKAWRTPRTHAKRGNAYEALLQIWHYWGGIYAATVDSHGQRHVIQATDDPTDVYSLADPDVLESWIEEIVFPESVTTLWDNADADVEWARFWVILRPPAAIGITANPDWGDPDLWGGAIGVPGTRYLLGQAGATAEDVSAMRTLFQELHWNPGNTIPEWLLLCLDPEATPEPEPDGTWQYWSKDSSGVRLPARIAEGWRFWSLDPQRNNTYAGIRSRPWPLSTSNVDNSDTYGGDRSVTSAWDPVTLPTGDVHAHARRWVSRVLMYDDGTVIQ